ncbi:MAG: hypothetical protein ISS12_07130 [Candidatus Marinimicrobia bacterium]|nr:hypothetical protein [FCB group bacterium]MBL7121743.1 hypothetical protein [Candidatus Neomarinimicrobiota bacterium]
MKIRQLEFGAIIQADSMSGQSKEIPAIQALRAKLRHTQHYIHYHLPKEPVFGQYYSDITKYKNDVVKFFDLSDEEIASLAYLNYPISSRVLFDHELLTKVIQQIPEFLLSLMQEGNSFLFTLYNFHTIEPHPNVKIEYSMIRELSENIFFIWNQISDIEISVATEEEKLIQLSRLPNAVEFDKLYYDLLGCFQMNLMSQVWYLESRGASINLRQNVTSYQDSAKGLVLSEVVGFLALPYRSAYETSVEVWDITSIRNNIIENLRNAKFIESIYEAFKHKTTLPEIDSFEFVGSIQEPSTKYGGHIDSLKLIMPEDADSDQSPVLLKFFSGDTYINEINLSHTEGSFVYFLGAERNAEGKFWLSEPEKHHKILDQIWEEFCLPQHFKDEKDRNPDKVGLALSWIWDFQNANRKGIRNRIHSKIKKFPPPLRNLNLIQSVKSETSKHGGIYKLHSQIKFVEFVAS